MHKVTRLIVLVAAIAAGAAPLQAQSGDAGAPAGRAAGLVLTPTFGYAGAYDDNIALFGSDNESTDYITTWRPGLSLEYTARQTQVGASYSGSLENYRTFSAFDRWNQGLYLNLRRRENVRFSWGAGGSAVSVPSTDFIEFGGIPFEQTAAFTVTVRGDADYRLSARNTLGASMNFQRVEFDSVLGRPTLPGGDVRNLSVTFRRRQSSRLSIGANYSRWHAAVTSDLETSNSDLVQAAAEYELARGWMVSGGLGIVRLQSTIVTEGQTAPSWVAAIVRNDGERTVQADYRRTFIPSFGYGGSVESQEIGASMQWPLARRLYTSNSLRFADTEPLTDLEHQLPLRSLRFYTSLGWRPHPLLQVEGFYSWMHQNTHIDPSRIARTRVGFQILTSKPMRIR